MLQGLKVEVPVLCKLNELPFRFQLTGSKYFGNSGPLSDTDFFCEYSEGVRESLESLGFRRLSSEESNYADSETKMVYYIMDGKESIDVQLVSDFEKKIRAQVVLSQHKELLFSLKKRFRQLLWNLVLSFV